MTKEEKEQTGKYMLQMARLLEDGCYQQEMLLKAVRIIDEALEQEPTTNNDLGVDCIDREKLIKWLNEWNITPIIKNPLLKHIQGMTSVTPQEPRWIPMSERLPKIAGVYRVTRYYPNNIMNPDYLVDACCFDGSYTWYDDNRINHERGHVNNIIAWQENPEPYKLESNVKQ